MAGLGHFSAAVATLLGSYITIHQQSPVFGAIIAWALAAVSDGMRKRLIANSAPFLNEENKKKTVGYTAGAKPMQWICTSGAVICGATSLLVVFGRKK